MTLPIVYHPDYVTPLPDGHRFPMPKFRLVKDILIRDNIVNGDQLHMPEAASESLLTSVHEPSYISAFCSGNLSRALERRMGLPWSEGLVTRTRTAVGGTLLTARLALQMGMACNTAGGTHHAFPGFGAGFCIFNDLAVAAKILLAEGAVHRVLIIDLDVHQGDGTAHIFANEKGVFTFSMHSSSNFPFRKQKSDLDIELPDGMHSDAYLEQLRVLLPDLFSRINPDLVLYDAGVDVHKDDLLGKLALDDDGIRCRDEMVLHFCLKHQVPVASVIGGGYDNDLEALAARHTILHRVAAQLSSQFSPTESSF